MRKRTACCLSLLAALCMGHSSCTQMPDAPKYDVCPVLISGDARCIPKNQPGKDEYRVPQAELFGGFWLSPESYGELMKYKSELEELIRSHQAEIGSQ